jgi:DNA primase
MSVDYDTFLHWAKDHFGEENIRIKKSEILTHSPFCDDHTYNLWMRPDGGKKEREKGVFRCWKTDTKGSLVKLVSDLDNIPYEEAEELLCGTISLRQLEKKLHEFYGSPVEPTIVIPKPHPVDLPPYTYLIEDLSQNHHYRQLAEKYLAARAIPSSDLYVCIKGDYKNRIVIPYYDDEGDMIYWNARTLSRRDDVIKYMKPDDESIDPTRFLYMKKHPKAGSTIHLTEGEFDAMSLNLAGFYGAACGGKSLHGNQIEILRKFKVVIATDNDAKQRDAGLEALVTIGNSLLEKGFPEVFYVRPPVGYKDWNALLSSKGSHIVKSYIDKHTKTFNRWTEIALTSNHM